MLTKFAPKVLPSVLDLSVNFIWSLNETEAIEARYVRRVDDYFIVYLSSHTGCNQACRFCHLTATKQVDMQEADMADFLSQADEVLRYYDSVVTSGEQPAAKVVHFNWMARGEPLMNKVILTRYQELFQALEAMVRKRGLEPRLKISTIFPASVPLGEIFEGPLSYPELKVYYSLYSLDAKFRKRWIPKAHEPYSVLDKLAERQRLYGDQAPLALHWAFIAGENDSPDDVKRILHAVEERDLKAKFNLVRYNPYSDAQGKESEEGVLLDRFELIEHCADSKQNTRIVPRVGKDVFASCGTFFNAAEHDGT